MQKAALVNVLHLVMQNVQKLMQDGLGTLFNANVNVFTKSALIYQLGTKQLVLVFQRLRLKI